MLDIKVDKIIGKVMRLRLLANSAYLRDFNF